MLDQTSSYYNLDMLMHIIGPEVGFSEQNEMVEKGLRNP